MVLCAPFVIIPIIIDEKKGGKISFLFLKFWGFLFSAMSGVFYKIEGREKLKPKQAYIFTANHSSYLDSPALVLAIPEQSRPLGKKEILDYPIFGFIFKHIGVTVDRSSLQSKIKSLEVIKKKLNKGIHIMIFPEGTMNNRKQLLLPFYDGAFRIAIETQTPVVPMAIKNSNKILPKGSWLIKAGIIKVQFGEPIPTHHLSLENVDELKQQTYEILKKMLEEN
jgi:1-acyl-sn-glycerol-3-phosphate acyltransferase